MTSKEALRLRFREVRGGLSLARREEARVALFDQLQERCREGLVLSFSSWKDEIETDLINRWLADEERLLLPRVEGSDLLLFRVTDIDEQLVTSRWGIAEPNLDRCISVEEVRVVLVPGLAFDKQGHRLGYGRGYYDRLLPRLSTAVSIGIGFREQLSERLLPVTKGDVPLGELVLV